MTFDSANEPKHDVSAFLPLPFILMPASQPPALYTALRYARKRCDNCKQKTCVVTLDLPLFLKAIDILPFVVVRLGGSHVLMSFMGAVGALMGGSGLTDLWKEVYAINKPVSNRTGGLWVQYFDQVEIIEIMTTFVRAERTGDWRLHLYCVGQTLPHLAAAGHLHYAKDVHLYLQDIQKLEAKMTAFEFEKSAESEKAYGGIWSDMIRRKQNT
ncbi:hypothetical protein FOCC_FOCC007328, partial [Frankliniella occidentalis]